jgi:hypothetical protein
MHNFRTARRDKLGGQIVVNTVAAPKLAKSREDVVGSYISIATVSLTPTFFLSATFHEILAVVTLRLTHRIWNPAVA